jgi:hypothetical protein
MKTMHEILAFALLLAALIFGYYYFNAESTSVNNVMIQKIGGKAEKETKHDADAADNYEKNENHQEEEADGAEAALVIAGEAA